MANIVDYLAWRGDLTFAERPFNDVDNIILSTLSYLDFSGIVPGPGEGAVSLAQASSLVLEETEGNVDLRVRSLAKLDPNLLVKLSTSRRFGNILLHDCVDRLDVAKSLQFAALQMDVTPERTYVSFRGTDSTLVGWRENFMLSFTITEAQREALTYLEVALAEARSHGRKVYVGGHSKGGNLALFAALSCPADLQEVIERVWNNDGPGISHKIISIRPQKVFGDRYKKIVPSYDMVGIIFEHDSDPRSVVASSATGALQHDPFTWKVLPRGIEELDDLSMESKIMRSALKTWLENVSLEERAVLVDQFFGALEASGAHTLFEVTESFKSMKTVLSAMGEMDSSTKELLMSLAGSMVAKTMDVAASSALHVAQAAFEELTKRPDKETEALP